MACRPERSARTGVSGALLSGRPVGQLLPSQPPLLKLPTELIERIAEVTSPSDLLSLRLVSRKIQKDVFQCFTRKCISERSCSVLDLNGLRKLQCIVFDHHLSRYVRSLTLHMPTRFTTTMQGTDRKEYAPDMREALQEGPVHQLQIVTILRQLNMIGRCWLSLNLTSRRQMLQLPYIVGSAGDCTSDKMSTWELCSAYPFVQPPSVLIPFTRFVGNEPISAGLAGASMAYSSAYHDFLEAVVNGARHCIHDIKIDDLRTIDVRLLLLNFGGTGEDSPVQSFASLQTLHLVLTTLADDWQDSTLSVPRASRSALWNSQHAMLALGAQANTFHLHGSDTMYNSLYDVRWLPDAIYVTDILMSSAFHNLTTLCLHGLPLIPWIFISVALEHRDTLRTLKLHDILLHGRSWRLAFMYLGSHFQALDSVYFENLRAQRDHRPDHEGEFCPLMFDGAARHYPVESSPAVRYCMPPRPDDHVLQVQGVQLVKEILCKLAVDDNYYCYHDDCSDCALDHVGFDHVGLDPICETLADFRSSFAIPDGSDTSGYGQFISRHCPSFPANLRSRVQHFLGFPIPDFGLPIGHGSRFLMSGLQYGWTI
ncbi:uncharacterized protein MYCGRDRAFT_111728 [Zymoseptoria tritici IPO323]|uniref:F-box domain-containing protein n=1 Tax=Zymoseptoria tritici (strain CBS 115943 / IPO323) TaxID=336722 RepID=F9XQI6_ZYMTI|nr:uncharacterized protein MYCGRDRAFT_111728 [Zymoseptoria tritici IPO323]EGP82653.1 hypothetical protein MYCGRDRAFT_111728 [Zymoseptoria tritici IPO323]